jgi:predicted nucleic acid-binding protein
MIHLDTNFLIAALTPDTPSEGRLTAWLINGEKFGISSIAWSEFLCGPVTEQERMVAALLLLSPEPFLAVDAEKAAELFNQTGRRSRSLADCQIAAVAMRIGAAIATENENDFKPFSQFGGTIA